MEPELWQYTLMIAVTENRRHLGGPEGPAGMPAHQRKDAENVEPTEGHVIERRYEARLGFRSRLSFSFSDSAARVTVSSSAVASLGLINDSHLLLVHAPAVHLDPARRR